ncbi:hypothetical protein ACFL6Y_09640 [Elusimicrobiota bacterium]
MHYTSSINENIPNRALRCGFLGVIWGWNIMVPVVLAAILFLVYDPLGLMQGFQYAYAIEPLLIPLFGILLFLYLGFKFGLRKIFLAWTAICLVVLAFEVLSPGKSRQVLEIHDGRATLVR